ncbi:MAG: hypothetical protein ACREEM_21325 [Blastocatellia bacterium]
MRNPTRLKYFAYLLALLAAALVFDDRHSIPASAAEARVGAVSAVAVSGNDIYVGGEFASIGNISARNIARFNRATGAWSALGGGVSGGVSAIAVSGSDVYVGGRFTSATDPGGGSVPATCIVKWNNAANTWVPLGTSGLNNNGVNGDVSAIAVSGGNVYIGGNFNLARNSGGSTVSANGVARWDGLSWSALGSGSGSTGNGVSSPGSLQVYAVAVSGSDVYVGGSFTKVHNSSSSGISANCVARWNSATGLWSALGAGQGGGANGVNGDVLAIAANGAETYIGGNFTSTYNNANAAVNAQHVARWNGASWNSLGTGSGPGGNGVNGTVNALAVGPGYLYVGGDFDTAYKGSGGGIGVNGISANCIARWDGTTWSALGAGSGLTGNGMDGAVHTITATSSEVFTGGEFITAFNSGSSKVTVNNVARWNGTTWSAFGAGSTSGAVTTVSAASFSGVDLSPEAIAAAFGTALATTTQSATTLPLPATLGGTTVKVKDSAGVERPASLFFVSPAQVNYQIPPATVAGPATVTITAVDGKVSAGSVQIAAVSPAIFTANANGQGVAAATALRIRSDGSQSFEPVARFDPSQNRFVAVPIDLGPGADQVFLVLFGSGFRYRSALPAVAAQMGGTTAEVLFAGPQGGLVGLDQMNLRIPRSLAGRGEIELALIVDGKPANPVRLGIK